jgi:hypothetical protein
MPMTSIQKRHEFPKGDLRIVAPDDAGRWISIENACISEIEGRHMRRGTWINLSPQH